ncbi:MAG: hypothetical protein ACO2PM_13575 [Pyrobaculum sp.]|jgi:hypothetical protein
MHPIRLTPILALALIATVALAQTTLYDNCYPNACVGTLLSAHWPFGGTPPQALVAIGSPAFGDYYNLTNQLRYLNVGVERPQSRWLNGPIIPGNIRSGLRNLTTGIGIGFTALGEFVAVLNNNIGGGLALARYNTNTADLTVTETLAVNVGGIDPRYWVNGWTLSVNLTLKDPTPPGRNHWIFIHAFAVYGNGMQAGGGRGVVLNLTTGPFGGSPSYPPQNWIVLPFDSSDIKPFTIVYDSPRLLVATGGVMKQIDLSILKSAFSGHYVVIDVNFTLIFPKAWPYAIVYYNYSVTASVPLISPYTIHLNRSAFSIRSSIYQVRGALSGTYNATIFTTSTPTACGGISYNLLHATPHATSYRNITMFAAVYPEATEFTPWDSTRFTPSMLNFFNIVLQTNYKKPTLASVGRPPGTVPFVILQRKSDDLSGQSIATAGSRTEYKDGVMFIYGYAYNVTNWVSRREPDPYIKALIEKTVFHPPNVLRGGPCSDLKLNYTIGVAGSMADPTDVLALGYVAFRTNALWYGLDVAPGAFQNLYTGSTTTGMANFIGLRNFGGLPVVLARLNSTFPYFYDRFNRFAFNKTYMMNITRPMGRINSTHVKAIFTVGGPVVNMLTRYTQDLAWYAPFIHNYATAPFPFAFSRHYVAHTPYIGSLFTTVWNTAQLFTANNAWPPITTTVTRGYAIISTAVDPNGTVILQIWGANAQDTYFAGKLLRDQPGTFSGAPAYIVVFEYNYRWRYPPTASPFFVIADVYKLSPIERLRFTNTFRLRLSDGDVKFS